MKERKEELEKLKGGKCRVKERRGKTKREGREVRKENGGERRKGGIRDNLKREYAKRKREGRRGKRGKRRKI